MISHTLCGRLFFTPSLLVKKVYFKNHSFIINGYTGIFNWKYSESREKMWQPYYSSEILLHKKGDTFIEQIEIRCDGDIIKSIDVYKTFKNGRRVNNLNNVLEKITMNMSFYVNIRNIK